MTPEERAHIEELSRRSAYCREEIGRCYQPGGCATCQRNLAEALGALIDAFFAAKDEKGLLT